MNAIEKLSLTRTDFANTLPCGFCIRYFGVPNTNTAIAKAIIIAGIKYPTKKPQLSPPRPITQSVSEIRKYSVVETKGSAYLLCRIDRYMQ